MFLRHSVDVAQYTSFMSARGAFVTPSMHQVKWRRFVVRESSVQHSDLGLNHTGLALVLFS